MTPVRAGGPSAVAESSWSTWACSAGSIVVTPHNCDVAFDLQFVPAGQRSWPGRAIARRSDWSISRCASTSIARACLTSSTMADVGSNGPRRIPAPTYAIDDQTAVKVADGTPSKSSPRGNWKLFAPGAV